jgi:hypothetical protein
MGSIETLRKKRRSLESELIKAQGVEYTVARAKLLVSSLYLFTPAGVKSATIQDWENDGVDIDLVLDPQDETGLAEADADAFIEKSTNASGDPRSFRIC